MPAQILDGRKLATELKNKIKQKIEKHVPLIGSPPGLGVILLGEDPASTIYVRNKQDACKEVGIQSFYSHLPLTTTEEELLQLIDNLNKNNQIHGILLQLPLPAQINTDPVIERIYPYKDVDGFHPYNLGRLAQRNPLIRPCTPKGIMLLLNSIGFDFKSSHAVIIGASNIVGRPLALELLIAGATVTVCHRFTQNLAPYVKSADLLISAVGLPGLIKGAWIKKGATVVDVGITRLSSGKIAGDIEFQEAIKNAAWITPVPGGVGPMTVACLLDNTVESWLTLNSQP